jgi:hypothetical protein
MAVGTTRRVVDWWGDGEGEGLVSGLVQMKSWTIWCNNAIHAEDRHHRQSRARASARG